MPQDSYFEHDLPKLILNIRGRRVMIDADLAKVYGVATKRLNEQVRRNRDRFPADFTFQLTQREKDEVVANCDHLENLKYSKGLPSAFTEHGALMLASVLSSPTAIAASVEVVRAFVKMRELLNSNREFAQNFEKIERKFAEHDHKFKVVFDAVRQIMTPQFPAKRTIGIKVKE